MFEQSQHEVVPGQCACKQAPPLALLSHSLLPLPTRQQDPLAQEWKLRVASERVPPCVVEDDVLANAELGNRPEPSDAPLVFKASC